MTISARRLSALFLMGIGCWLWWGVRDLSNEVAAPIIAAALSLVLLHIPALGRPVARMLDRIRRPSSRTAAVTAIVIGVLGAIVLYTAAVLRGRDFFPVMHDGQMYLLQTRMLAHGRLWLPPHPLADFFETFFVLVRPVYAPMYFPGTALAFVPAIWLHVPIWLWSLLIAGATVGLLFWIVTQMIDAVAGGLAALVLLSLPVFRGLSIFEMSHSLMALWAVALVFFWLKWRDDRRWRWIILIGIVIGWSAITRPVDALAYALCIGAGILADVIGRKQKSSILLVPFVVVVSAAPFLVLQLIFNLGVTGHAMETPYARYVRLDEPGAEFSFSPGPLDAPLHAASQLPQKQEYFRQYVLPVVHRFRLAGLWGQWPGGKFDELVKYTLPHPLLLVLFLPALLVLNTRPRRALFFTFPLLVIFYSFNPFLLAWYMLSWLPAIILGLMLGLESIAAGSPTPRMTSAGLTIAVAVISIFTLFSADRTNTEQWSAPFMESIHWLDAFHPPRAAVVLFQYIPGFNFNQEPVYNLGAAGPDEQWVIRAHDLGPQRNQELFGYYAAHQPQREIYEFDWTTGRLIDLGNVQTLIR